MRGIKFLLGSAALLAVLSMAPAARAQVAVQIGVPAPVVDVDVPPVCPYGYYEAPPYACAPVGFYGPGFFFNGIFLGVGPWAGWGYGHGWGEHRFVDAGGGRYHGRGGWDADHGHWPTVKGTAIIMMGTEIITMATADTKGIQVGIRAIIRWTSGWWTWRSPVTSSC